MRYRFRIRVDLASACSLHIDAEEFVLSPTGSDVVVRLVPADGAAITLLKDARSVVLVGGDYSDEQEALQHGQEWLSRFRRFLIATRTGVDFGERAATSAWTEYGLAGLAAEFGVPRVLNDVHGLSVHATTPQPRFVKGAPTLRRGPGADALRGAVAAAWADDQPLPDRVRISYDLMSASMSTADEARFMLLMMAFETLLEAPLRPEPALSFVDGLIAQVKSSALPADDRNSLRGALNWLRCESIGRTGKSYVRRLEPKLYNGVNPSRFFALCYEVRSDLVHGKMPRPPRETVDPLAATLEVMVNDLLRCEIGLGVEA